MQLSITDAARVLYSTMRAFRSIRGDTSMPEWPYASVWQVRDIVRVIQHMKDFPQANAMSCHTVWCTEMTSRGWRYGRVWDHVSRTDPGLRKYGDLSPEEYAYWELVRATGRALIPYITETHSASKGVMS